MYLVFMDESGDVSFSETSNSNYFIITCLSIPEHHKHKLKNKIKKKKEKLYKLGWPKNVEVKANVLHQINYNAKRCKELGISIDGDKFILEIIESIINACSPQIDYFALNKTKIIDASFKTAPYGVAYNFFSAKLLCPIVLQYGNCKLFPDPRNKETRPKLKFADYVSREIIWEAKLRNLEPNFSIHNLQSHTHPGLQAVDLFSWSINRYFAHTEDRFYKGFSKCVKNGIRWYC